MRERAAAGHVLLASVGGCRRPEARRKKDALPPWRYLRTLQELADFHGISPAVYLYLRDQGNSAASAASHLAISYHSAMRTHLRALRDLSFLSSALGGLSGGWLVMKGPVLSELVYRRPDLRAYTDVDVIVPGSSLAEALHLLETAGCRIIDDDWHLLREAMRGQLRVLLPSGTLVDLHWHLLSHARIRSDFTISMEGLFARRRLIRLAEHRLATLDPVDTVVHLAVHACLSGGNRLLWIKDMEQCILNQVFSWDEVIERAHEWSAGLVVATHLARAMRLIRLDVPRDVVEELARGRLWPSLVANLDRLVPVERASGRRSATRLVARATRSDASSSFLELRRRATAWMRGGAPTGLPFPSPGAHARTAPSEGGQRRVREAFLRAVEQEADAGVQS